MIEIIRTDEDDQFTALMQRLRLRSVAVDRTLIRSVERIIDNVRNKGDQALTHYAAIFDNCELKIADLKISENALKESASRVDKTVLNALREAIRRVRMFHSFERQESWDFTNPNEVRLGQRVTPIKSVGVYVPGGSAGYASSVVMNIVPAQVAGVGRIVIVTPPGTIEKSPAVAAALLELNATEVFAAGGAQAIAALAYGTQTVPRVDKIVGPGNRYVAAAKKLVFGLVGIDSIAGPTEVVILADDSAHASFLASDLLAQAEHSDDASSILITNSPQLAVQVAEQVKKQASSLPRRPVIEKSMRQYGAIVVVKDWDEACALVDELAPEHFEIIARNADYLASRVQNAGAIFLGEYSPEAVGDYLAGPNHVLPTSRAARFSSALSVYDFIKRTSIIKYTAKELENTAQSIAALARAEGLEAHARSALIRLEGN